MDEFKINFTKDIVVVKVDIITATLRDAKPLWDEFESHLIFNQKKIIIDFSDCHSVDSTFMGMIVKIYKKVKDQDVIIKIAFPQEKKAFSFQMIGISKIIDCYDSLEEALDSFD
jgi:anti-anti-sigma factor